MPLVFKKGMGKNPDWQDLIGKRSDEVDQGIREKWSYPLTTVAMGYSGYKCKIYQTEKTKAILFFDEEECLLDVFEYVIGQDIPDNPGH